MTGGQKLALECHFDSTFQNCKPVKIKHSNMRTLKLFQEQIYANLKGKSPQFFAIKKRETMYQVAFVNEKALHKRGLYS